MPVWIDDSIFAMGAEDPATQSYNDPLDKSDLCPVVSADKTATTVEEPLRESPQSSMTSNVIARSVGDESQKTVDTKPIRNIRRPLHDLTWSLQDIMKPFLLDFAQAPIVPASCRQAIVRSPGICRDYDESRTPYFVPRKKVQVAFDSHAMLVLPDHYIHAPTFGKHGFIIVSRNDHVREGHGQVVPAVRFISKRARRNRYIGHYEITCVDFRATLLDQHKKVEYPQSKFRRQIDKSDLLKQKFGLEYTSLSGQNRMNAALKYCTDSTGNFADMTVILLRLVHFDEKLAHTLNGTNVLRAQPHQSHSNEVPDPPNQDERINHTTPVAVTNSCILDASIHQPEDTSKPVIQDPDIVTDILQESTLSRKRAASSPIKIEQPSSPVLVHDHCRAEKRPRH